MPIFCSCNLAISAKIASGVTDVTALPSTSTSASISISLVIGGSGGEEMSEDGADSGNGKSVTGLPKPIRKKPSIVVNPSGAAGKIIKGNRR